MSEFLELKIDNSKRNAVKSGKWKDPGAKLYSTLLGAHYYDGGIPASGVELDAMIKEGKYKQWDSFLKEAYLVAPVSQIKNSPYGVTPYGKSGCKYPHHVIRNGRLLLSLEGVKRAYDMAFYQHSMTPEVKRHLNKHMKELGIEPFFHHGQLYWNESASDTDKMIEENFLDIENYIMESLGINLRLPTELLNESELFSEKSHPKPRAESVILGEQEDYIRGLNNNDVNKKHFHDWFFKMDEFINDSPSTFDLGMFVYSDTWKNYCYGYFIDNKLEGIIRIRYINSESIYKLSFLFVNSDLQGRGIGNALMEHTIGIHGDKKILLGVFADNKPAIGLYKKYGFKITSTEVTEDEPGIDKRFIGRKRYIMERDPIKLINESIDWIEKFVYDDSFRESVNEPYTMRTIPDIMYFSSPDKLSVLQGKVFLSPYAGISSIFILNRSNILKEYADKCIDRDIEHISCNLGYREWNFPDSQLTMPLNEVHIFHNIRDFTRIEKGISTGYIYTVDISDVKHQLSLFVSGDPNREVVYQGDVPLKILNVQEHTVNWEIQFSEDEVEKHGEGKVIYKNEAIEESVTGPRFDRLTSPEELLKWMDCIQYGWISSKDHSTQGTGDDDDEQEFYKYYRLQHPRDLVKSKIGVCWDQAELERYWFDKHNISNAVLYFEIEDGENCPTHTFLVYNDSGKFKWFEHSWGQYKGIHTYDSMLELIKDVSNKHRKSNNDFKSSMKITFMDKAPNYNITCEEFMNYARSQRSAYIPSDDELGNIIVSGELSKYRVTDEELNKARGEIQMNENVDDLDWIESYLMEEGEAPPPVPGEEAEATEQPAADSKKPEKKPESMPKKTDKVESDKNGKRRKNLYIEFINWCRDYNPKNMFGSVFDPEAFHTTYPFVPDELRYFYRLANPMLCVLAGNLTFFAVAELRKVNSKNSHLNEMMIFAATDNDFRVFSSKDKKVYRGTDENGALTLHEVLGDTFDTYIQKMINKGDILNAPLEEPEQAQ